MGDMVVFLGCVDEVMGDWSECVCQVKPWNSQIGFTLLGLPRSAGWVHVCSRHPEKPGMPPFRTAASMYLFLAMYAVILFTRTDKKISPLMFNFRVFFRQYEAALRSFLGQWNGVFVHTLCKSFHSRWGNIGKLLYTFKGMPLCQTADVDRAFCTISWLSLQVGSLVSSSSSGGSVVLILGWALRTVFWPNSLAPCHSVNFNLAVPASVSCWGPGLVGSILWCHLTFYLTGWVV